jgi:hypothetical protein
VSAVYLLEQQFVITLYVSVPKEARFFSCPAFLAGVLLSSSSEQQREPPTLIFPGFPFRTQHISRPGHAHA